VTGKKTRKLFQRLSEEKVEKLGREQGQGEGMNMLFLGFGDVLSGGGVGKV